MKTPKLSLIISVSLLLSNICFSQLIVDAGRDTVFCSEDIIMAVIGGNPSTTGGLAPYTYAWSVEYQHGSYPTIFTASSMLEDTTVSNPAFKKGAIPDSAFLYLHVKDANDSIGVDSVLVRLSMFTSCLGECREYIKYGDSVKIGHCTYGGIPPYVYSWSPEATLSDPNVASPWAKPLTDADYELFITDSYGCKTTSSCKVFLIPTIIESSITNSHRVRLYPNPTENQVTITVDSEDYLNLNLLIINADGKLVKNLKVISKETVLDFSNSIKGIYLYQLKRYNTIVENGKFIIN